jgi:hypothetical protein
MDNSVEQILQSLPSLLGDLIKLKSPRIIQYTYELFNTCIHSVDNLHVCAWVRTL